MRQQSFARSKGREDDQLPAFTEPNKRLSADTIIISITDKSRASQSGKTVIHTIRDEYSGMALALPSSTKTHENFYQNFKFFAGLIGTRAPDVLVKSDVAGEIIKAVEELGWHSDTSLANTWPHNATHERWHGTYKSTVRAALHQSGFPIEKAWDLAVQYGSVALSITKGAPILPWEKDASGKPLESAKAKSNQTCWECHHGASKVSTGQRDHSTYVGCLIWHEDIQKVLEVQTDSAHMHTDHATRHCRGGCCHG